LFYKITEIKGEVKMKLVDMKKVGIFDGVEVETPFLYKEGDSIIHEGYWWNLKKRVKTKEDILYYQFERGRKTNSHAEIKKLFLGGLK
jgi:hypothetical protein